MAKIDPRLLQKLETRLNVSRSRLYALIAATARERTLDNRLAAIALANENGLSVNRFATSSDLAEIRGSNRAVPIGMSSSAGGGPRRVRTLLKRPLPKRKKNTVWVVHGRNTVLRDSLFTFLRSIGLNPLEFSKAILLTRKAAPYIGEILDAAFREAAAVVVLLTPDDQAQLRRKFQKSSDPAYERKLTGQARPNVLFEAGTAFGSHAKSTILVEIGKVRPFSDVAGRHAIHLGNDAASRKELANRLHAAGCNVDTTGTDWLRAGDFSKQLT